MADRFKGDLDPQIADLLSSNSSEDGSIPDLNELIGEESTTSGKKENHPVYESFNKIERNQENSKPFFKDQDYYKKIIGSEGEEGKKVHEFLMKFIKATDPQEKSDYRARIIPAYWNLASNIAGKISQNLIIPKLLLLRFNAISPSLISNEQQNIIARIIFENKTGEPVHYLDEWLILIAKGRIGLSATDELKRTTKDDHQKIIDKVEQTKGHKTSEIILLQKNLALREDLENQLRQIVEMICTHDIRYDSEGLKDAYSPEQKKALSSISDILRKLSTVDKGITKSYNVIENIEQNIETLYTKADGVERAPVDSSQVIAEFNSIRQMSKLCVGRKGNHFPILMKNYFRPNINEMGIRENVINIMAKVESLDKGLFLRTFKNQTMRIVPHIILLPNYGERGVCWEPFERKNRATSRGRVAIPIYPKNLYIAILSALADLRWQVAKEKAHHYWMEEGITGNYYQWFQTQKLRGDVKEYFINDYILWITKESEGTQKLEREVRGIFWRMIPFPQNIKDKLRNRGFVYNELYKKDINISRSDGY